MEEEMQGGQAQQEAAMGAGAGGQEVMIEEVIQLLMQGVQPQELVDAGVPVELIEQAIMIIEQQMQSQQAPTQGGQGQGTGMGKGLAGKMAGM